MPKLNMAAFGKRAHHSKGFYRSLDRRSSADFTQKSRRNRNLPVIYLASMLENVRDLLAEIKILQEKHFVLVHIQLFLI